MAIIPDNVVTLRDGRALGYAEWGDPDGAPVLHFHGSPSSRLEGAMPELDAVAARLRIRVLAPERPGLGLSDPKPHRTILDWPADVLEFADALGLSRFSVYGASGGGPYAAACAYRIAHRLRAAGIVCGLAPMTVPEARRGMHRRVRLQFFLGRHAPWLLRRLVRRMATEMTLHGSRIIADMMKQLPEPDRLIYADPARQQRAVAVAREAFRRGEEGAYVDLLLASRPWGFELNQVPMVVNLWFGGRDVAVPESAGRYLARSLARSEARFYPDEGHASLLINRYEDVLTGLTATAAREGDKSIVEW